MSEEATPCYGLELYEGHDLRVDLSQVASRAEISQELFDDLMEGFESPGRQNGPLTARAFEAINPYPERESHLLAVWRAGDIFWREYQNRGSLMAVPHIEHAKVGLSPSLNRLFPGESERLVFQFLFAMSRTYRWDRNQFPAEMRTSHVQEDLLHHSTSMIKMYERWKKQYPELIRTIIQLTGYTQETFDRLVHDLALLHDIGEIKVKDRVNNEREGAHMVSKDHHDNCEQAGIHFFLLLFMEHPENRRRISWLLSRYDAKKKEGTEMSLLCRLVRLLDTVEGNYTARKIILDPEAYTENPFNPETYDVDFIRGKIAHPMTKTLIDAESIMAHPLVQGPVKTTLAKILGRMVNDLVEHLEKPWLGVVKVDRHPIQAFIDSSSMAG